MNLQQVAILIENIHNTDSIKSRDEMVKKLEKECSEVFHKLCIYEYRFIEDHDVESWTNGVSLIRENGYLHISSVPKGYNPQDDKYSKKGITISYVSTDRDEDNRYNLRNWYVIPYKYFDYTDEDWDNLNKSKKQKEIDFLQKIIEEDDGRIEYIRRGQEEKRKRIEELKKELNHVN